MCHDQLRDVKGKFTIHNERLWVIKDVKLFKTKGVGHCVCVQLSLGFSMHKDDSTTSQNLVCCHGIQACFIYSTMITALGAAQDLQSDR